MADLRLGKRLGAELGVVFLGAWSAFMVEGWRDELGDRERGRQIVAAIEADLRDFEQALTGFTTEVERGMQAYREARARGEQPVPYYLRVAGSERPPLGVWDASVQSGLLDIVDPALLADLTYFYSEVEGISDKYARYSAFIESRIWPLAESAVQDGGPAGRDAGEAPAFYDSRTGELLPEFRAHHRHLEELRGELAQQARWAGQLADHLRETIPEAGFVEGGSMVRAQRYRELH